MSTISTDPLIAAACSGVMPRLSAQLGSAPTLATSSSSSSLRCHQLPDTVLFHLYLRTSLHHELPLTQHPVHILVPVTPPHVNTERFHKI